MITRRATWMAAAVLALGPGVALALDASAGVALYNEGKYEDAAAALQGAGDVEGQAYLAASLVKLKKYAEAEAPATAAAKESPTHGVAVSALGESLVNQRKWDAAVEKMGAAIEAKNDQAYAYYWRVHAHSGKSQHDRAVADFEMFLRLAPQAPEAATVQRLLASLR